MRDRIDDLGQSHFDLRELFRQPRLAPRPIAYQMAWLVALNEGRFEGLDAAGLAPLLQRLSGRIDHAPALDADRGDWVEAVTKWLGAP